MQRFFPRSQIATRAHRFASSHWHARWKLRRFLSCCGLLVLHRLCRPTGDETTGSSCSASQRRVPTPRTKTCPWGPRRSRPASQQVSVFAVFWRVSIAFATWQVGRFLVALSGCVSSQVLGKVAAPLRVPPNDEDLSLGTSVGRVDLKAAASGYSDSGIAKREKHPQILRRRLRMTNR